MDRKDELLAGSPLLDERSAMLRWCLACAPPRGVNKQSYSARNAGGQSLQLPTRIVSQQHVLA